MPYDAGLKVGVEGNAEFKKAVRGINDELKTMDSALRLVESAYKGQMNSMDALKAKGDALQAVYGKQGELVRDLTAALQNAQRAESEYAGKADEIKSKLAAAQAEMERLKNSTGDTSKEQKKLADEIGDLSKALKTSEQAQSSATRSVNDWQRQVNDATVKLNNLEGELKDNKRYMSEAEKSTDKAATSIDRYGKEAKEAAVATDDAAQKGGLLSKIFAGGFMANIATQAVNAVWNALKNLGRQAVDTADKIGTLSEQTGFGIDTLQEFQYAGERLDVSLDVFTGSWKRLITNIDAATEGSKAAVDSFSKIGVSIYDTNGQLRNSNELYYEVIDALGKMTNETERDAAAQDLLGRSATDLNPLIKAGTDELKKLSEEAHNTGAVMSDEAVAALDDLGETLNQTKQKAMAFVGEGLAAIIGTGKTAAEEINDLSDSIGKTDDTLKLIDRYRTLQAELMKSGLSETEVASKTEELNKVKRQLIEVSGGVVTAVGLENGTFDSQVDALDGLTESQKRYMTFKLQSVALENTGVAAQQNAAKAASDYAKSYDSLEGAYKSLQEAQDAIASGDVFNDMGVRWESVIEFLGTSISILEQSLQGASDAMMQTEENAAKGKQALQDLVVIYGSVPAAANAMGISLEELNERLGNATTETGKLSQIEQAAAGAVDNLKTKLDDLQTSYNEMYQSAKEAIDGSIGLWEEMDTSAVKSAKEVQEALDSQIVWLSRYNQNLTALENRKIDGVDLQPLLDNLSEVNKDTAAILSGLSTATDDEIREIVKSLNTLDYSKSTLAGTIADMKAEFVGEVDTLMKEAIDTMRQSDAAGDAASDTMQGYIDQAYDMRDEVIAAHRSVAKAANQAYKDELKINSPSRVAMEATEDYFDGHIMKAVQMIPKMEAAYSEPARKAHLAMQSSIPSVVEQPARESGAQTAAQIGGSISKALSGLSGSTGRVIDLTFNITEAIDGRQLTKATRKYRIEEDDLAGPNLIE